MATPSTTVTAAAHLPHRTTVPRTIETKVQATQQEKDFWASKVDTLPSSSSCWNRLSCLKRESYGPLVETTSTCCAAVFRTPLSRCCVCIYHRNDFCYGALKDGVKEVYGFVKSVVDNKQPTKFSFFSAHDNSIVALLGALQIEVGSQIPQYHTMLAFEVYEDKATTVIMVIAALVAVQPGLKQTYIIPCMLNENVWREGSAIGSSELGAPARSASVWRRRCQMAPSAPRSQTNTDGLTTSTASPSWLSPGLSAVCTQWVPWNACRNARWLSVMSDSERRRSVGASISAELETECARLPQYGTMLAFEVYEDEASHEFFIKPRYENEEVFFAGHTQDPLCPFLHFESLALDFLSYKA
uniref:Histidine acid phosphatase n=1 Tax=Phytophthora ramorum TaxID=164328 RepID=H3H2H0_PHYRM